MTGIHYEGTHDRRDEFEVAAAAADAAARAAALTSFDVIIEPEPEGGADDNPESCYITDDADEVLIGSEPAESMPYHDLSDEDNAHGAGPNPNAPKPGAYEGPGPGDTPPPNDHPETGGNGETNEGSGLRHVPGLRREGDGDTPVQNRPKLGAIIDAARRGDAQILSITRSHPGAARNVRIEASPSLIPPDAKRPRPGDTAEKEPQFKYWARITATRRPPEENEKAGDKPPNKGEAADCMQLADAIKTYDGTFKLMVVGRPVDAKAERQLSRTISTAHRIAERKYSQQEEARRLALIKDEIGISKQSALINRTVVIGVETKEELERAARHFAAQGFKSGDHTMWSVETESPRGPIRGYSSAQAVLDAGVADENCYITADQFSEEVRYPDENIPGMTVEDKEIYAASREIPKDAPSVRLGDIMVDGQRGEELRITLKDMKRHTLICASSGAGKTVLVRQIATDVIREDYAASQTPEGAGRRHRAVVVVDFEKVGNYTESLAAQLAGAGLPPERATVHRIAPGSEGMRANVNLLRLTGTTPSQQVNIATRSLTANIQEPQAERVFSKFAGMAISRAYEKLGWNMATDKSKFPMGTPATPDMEQVAIAVEEVIAELTFRPETQGDLGAFTQTEIADFLRGIPGQLFTGGYDIDWTKVRDNKGVTVIELGRITDPEAKRIALTAIMRGMAASLDMENPTGEDTDETKLVMFMDETGGIFDANTTAGQDNAHFFSNLRGKGAAMVIAQQGGISNIHHDVTDSTSNIIGMQMNNPEDQEWIAARVGATDESKKARILKSVEEGGGIYYGLRMPQGPVEFRTTAPGDIPRNAVRYTSDLSSVQQGEGAVTDARHLVDRGADAEFYDGSTKIEARDWLIKNQTGTLVRAAAELGAALVPLGRDPLEISGQLKTELREMWHDPENRKLLECAITLAITKAVDSRPEIMQNMTRKELTDFLLKDTFAQIAGGERPEREWCELQIVAGYYSLVKDAIINETAPRKLEMVPSIKRALGRAITGRTADEQLDSLKTLEKDSIRVVSETVKNAAGNELADLSAAETNLRRLVGKAANPEAAIASIRNRVSDALKEPLTDAEIAAFDRIVESIRSGEEAREIGYPDIRGELERRIAASKISGAVLLSDLEALYQEDFSVDERGNELTTSRQQLAEVQRRENVRTAKSKQKVDESNLLFAPDLIEGGLTMDRIIETLIKGAQRQGHAYDHNRRLHHGGQQEDLSLFAMYKRADARAEEWGTRIGVHILRSSNFGMSPGTAHFLSRWVAEHLEHIREEAAEFLRQEEAKAQRAAAGAK